MLCLLLFKHPMFEINTKNKVEGEPGDETRKSELMYDCTILLS